MTASASAASFSSRMSTETRIEGSAPGGGAGDYDAVIVGASLAGCSAAILLGRAGARVALVEKRPDPRAFKRVCTHFVQSSAVPSLERLGLLGPMMEAGAIRYVHRFWTRWGWVQAPRNRVRHSVNLPREALDPIVRDAASSTPGVELIFGRTATCVLREEGVARGVTVRDRAGGVAELRGSVLIGADGRDSRVAELAGIPDRRLPHGRIAYTGYFEGPLPAGAPDPSAWMLDPDFATVAPLGGDLALYGAMPTKARLPEFKRDPEAALVSFIASLPEAPPIREARLVSPMIGKVEMPNRIRGPVGQGVALIGDAALASDPLFGIGCGWAFQSAEWLADSLVPALRGEESLGRALSRYRRRHRRELRGHALLIHDYATGRRFNLLERTLFSAAARDERVAVAMDRFATRSARPGRTLGGILPRAIAVNAGHAFGHGGPLHRGASGRVSTG